MLIDNCNIVINSGASVRFNQPLKLINFLFFILFFYFFLEKQLDQMFILLKI
jgi:hypothetical protein